MTDDAAAVAAVLAARRSCRSYVDTPIAAGVVDALVDAFRRAPTAGNTWAFDLVVLQTPEDRARYWDTTLPDGPRRRSFRWPGLLAAPLLIVAVVDPGRYVERYGEADKAQIGLGTDADSWPVPYWWVDGGAATMALLTTATAHGLGSLMFGPFHHESAVKSALGIPADRRIFATIAVGESAPDVAGRSATRGRPSPDRWTHDGAWGNGSFPREAQRD